MAPESSLYETIKRTAIAHTKGYEAPKPFDNDTIQQYRSPDCIHYLHPRESIPDPFNKPIDRPKFAQFMEFFGNALDKLQIDIKDIVVDTNQHTAVVRLNAVMDFKAIGEDTPEKGYTVEYMWFMEMDSSGEKIVRVEEFLDPQRLMDYVRPKAQQYAEYHQKNQGQSNSRLV